MTPSDSRAELTQSGLNLIQQAISIFDADMRLAVSNRAYQQMFDLPDALTAPGTSFEATIAYLVERGEYGPQPQPQTAAERQISPDERDVTGFVFKVQANMDPKHRDRVAFVRLASGHFERGMKMTHVRSKKPMAVSNPVLFLAADRELAEEAWAGDIIGIPNHGQLRIGDALTEGEALRFTGIPSFAPELLQTVRAGDPMKAKHLEKALMQFAEEGAAKVFKPMIGSGFIVGVVGALQFEVLASRIEQEYGLPVRFEPSQFTSARWVSGEREAVDRFAATNKQHMATDHDGDTVYLTRLQWDIDRVVRDHPELKLTATKEMMV